MTPGKQEVLWAKLVELKETPGKDGEAPGYRGEPIGITWPEVVGEYQGNCSAEGYTLSDGTPLNLSEKDQKWLGLKDTFAF